MTPEQVMKSAQERGAEYQAVLDNVTKIKGKKFSDVVRCIARLQVSSLVLCSLTRGQGQAHQIVHAVIDQCTEDMLAMFDSDDDAEEAGKAIVTLMNLAKIT